MSFHLFPQLPAELRIQIWQLTAAPRILKVDVYMYSYDGPSAAQYPIKSLRSPTPVPSSLHTCHEARQSSPYERAFDRGGVAERYIWVNYTFDTVQLDEYLLDDPFLSLEAASIRRLRVEVAEAQMFATNRQDVMRRFRKLEAVHILSAQPVRHWCGQAGQVDWASPPENVKFIERSTGMVLDFEELCEWDFQTIQRLNGVREGPQ